MDVNVIHVHRQDPRCPYRQCRYTQKHRTRAHTHRAPCTHTRDLCTAMARTKPMLTALTVRAGRVQETQLPPVPRGIHNKVGTGGGKGWKVRRSEGGGERRGGGAAGRAPRMSLRGAGTLLPRPLPSQRNPVHTALLSRWGLVRARCQAPRRRLLPAPRSVRSVSPLLRAWRVQGAPATRAGGTNKVTLQLTYPRSSAHPTSECM